MNRVGDDSSGHLRRTYADRVRQLPEGGLISLLRDARSRGSVDLATGTPAAPQPADEVIEAACTALRNGVNQYEDPSGNAALRAGIADSLRPAANPDTEITVTVGATEAMLTALLSTVDPGDEVIVAEPFYDNFLGAIALTGARPRFVRLHAPDWRFDPAELAAAFGPRTKAMILNTPHNPTGRVFDRAELDQLAELCTRWNVTLISDEVYSAYTFDGRQHLSVAEVPGLADRSIVVGSLSKSHALSGWRIGFLRAAPACTSVLRQVHISTTGGTAAPLQRAVLESGILAPGAWQPAPQLQRMRDTVVETFTGIGLACGRPEGGCYLMADIRPVTSGDCESYVKLLLDHAGVLIAPGTLLYDDRPAGEHFVRIAFNKADEIIEDAARRIEGSRKALSAATG
ncbi:pyridoxal phosphate-dependent aminotransferase [Amycolatopsis sp. YIM 10]|uniref:pyridoxal phosphate-dependent aminotransferase n=1 Tax=Amycolatopsis sp. YIM 10 TaxID=2653857 RepID=UPI00129067EA|nr:aminotransferase class I/II-fold pyridoxal phosphate-dependent enzyme [Amycolatopsis sp. YIM 10]QFU89761.1 Arginine--pyruvate transaminase AruH [Amycolatopsis sp. YIM 10]